MSPLPRLLLVAALLVLHVWVQRVWRRPVPLGSVGENWYSRKARTG